MSAVDEFLKSPFISGLFGPFGPFQLGLTGRFVLPFPV